jgi:hypothetical protein
MNNRHNAGFDHHDQAPIATDQHRLLVVAPSWSHHANAQADVEPTWEAWPEILGTPPAGALDTGYVSAANLTAVEPRGLAPSIAGGRAPQHQHWSASGAPPLAPPPEASPLVTMADTRPTDIGHALERLRTCTVAPGIGLITEVLGFRPFSRRGLTAAAGAWCLVGWAFNLKRRHGL